MMEPILPPARLGVIGGGQLGRMFIQAAARLGYRTLVFSDSADCPAGQLADEVLARPLDDLTSLRDFQSRVRAVAVEFENVSAPALRWLQKSIKVNPGWKAVWVAQNRLREKRFLDRLRVPVARWWPLLSETELETARAEFVGPSILKTAEQGYDGKGQVRVDEPDRLVPAWERLGRAPCVLEQVVSFVTEVSCVVARAGDGTAVVYPVFLNDHRSHILDTSICPAPIGPAATQAVRDNALLIAESLRVVGLLTVEFFLKEDGSVIVNELAPRPHNSAHLTIEACVTSQFEQQVRALVGLPLGSTRLVAPAAMANLLGDLWQNGTPNWNAALALDPEVQLHLYGKKIALPGRKMGHLTVVDADPRNARERVLAARQALIS
jgi:5-(carboxyamino)imidazole ribonucleotide synthase